MNSEEEPSNDPETVARRGRRKRRPSPPPRPPRPPTSRPRPFDWGAERDWEIVADGTAQGRGRGSARKGRGARGTGRGTSGGRGDGSPSPCRPDGRGGRPGGRGRGEQDRPGCEGTVRERRQSAHPQPYGQPYQQRGRTGRGWRGMGGRRRRWWQGQHSQLDRLLDLIELIITSNKNQ
uniref:Uncharacterized protein n=1 Tax=Amphimedon queenslandica TaxID=400682 RepID=A0A1X7VDK3_AMPQE